MTKATPLSYEDVQVNNKRAAEHIGAMLPPFVWQHKYKSGSVISISVNTKITTDFGGGS